MKIIRVTQSSYTDSLDEYRSFATLGTVTVLGFFDGVHIAHRALIREAKEIANQEDLPLTVFTFFGDTNELKASAKRLFTDDEKLSLLEECGADCAIIADFSVFRDISAENFVKDFLVSALNTHVAISGFNFRFGKNASGNSDDLRRFMMNAGRGAEIFDEYLYENKTLSSSYIRALLSEKKLKEAAVLLGKPYFLSGKVSHGLGLGKSLGIPTINTELPIGRFILPYGVYLTAIKIDGKIYRALTNIGSCPTFEKRKAHIETFILDFDGNLYDQNVRIYFIAHLRDEKLFSSAEELIMQINIDKNRALAISGDVKWQEFGLN